MIEIRTLLQRLKASAHDDTLYLLEIISSRGGLFALNGNIVFMTLNTENCSSTNIKTEYLHLATNIYVSAFNMAVQSFENGYYNSIELYMQEDDGFIENLNAFITLCYTYSSHTEEIEFSAFFDSLVTLFQLPKEQNYKNLVGLYGELSVIKYFYDNYKVNIANYWHTDGVNSKIDFVTPQINIEVKTTRSDQLAFNIKHDQLFGNVNETYLAAVTISENNSGLSLNELIDLMLADHDYFNNLSFAINIEAEKRRISPKDAENRKFIFKSIKMFNSADICPFVNIPENVSNLTYKMNLLTSASTNIQLVIDENSMN